MKNESVSKVRVGVFFGGRSVEHEVSVITGLQAYYAFDTEKYAPVPVYITKKGEMYVGGDVGEIEAYKDLDALIKGAERVTLVRDGGGFFLVRYPGKKLGDNKLFELDVALPAVHGTNVEDGTLQGFFKSLGIPFVGCDVTASAIGMDKALTKAVLKTAGVPVVDCITLRFADYIADVEGTLDRVEAVTRYPVVSKPVNSGSSVGIKKSKDRDALRNAVDEAFTYASVVLVENCIANLKEINCSVLGDADEAVASVCEEPILSGNILSYGEKYLGEGGKQGCKNCGAKNGAKISGVKAPVGSKGAGMANLSRKIPADISADVEAKVKEYSVRAFKAIGCAGVTRIDYLYDTVSGELYLNELNTIPGSLSFYLWEATGMPYADMLDKLVKLALKRARTESELNFSFDTNILASVNLPHEKKTK